MNTVQPVTAAELPAIRALVEMSRLPVADLDTAAIVGDWWQTYEADKPSWPWHSRHSIKCLDKVGSQESELQNEILASTHLATGFSRWIQSHNASGFSHQKSTSSEQWLKPEQPRQLQPPVETGG